MSDFLRRQEQRIQRKTYAILTKQKNWAIKAMEPIFTRGNSFEDEVRKMLSSMILLGSIWEGAEQTTRGTMKRGADLTISRLKLADFGISFSLRNTEAISWYASRRAIELSDFRGNIDGTTKSRIEDIVLTGLHKGESYTSVAKQIMLQGESGVFSAKRAELIAIRENALAYEEGRAIPVREFAGKYPDRQMQKSWSTVRDGKVTAECQENEAVGWIGYAEFFPYDDGQIHAPRNGNPRCRCTTNYRVQ